MPPKRERSKTSRGASTFGRLRIRASFLAPAAELQSFCLVAKHVRSVYSRTYEFLLHLVNVRATRRSRCKDQPWSQICDQFFNVHLAFASGRMPQILKFALRRLRTRKLPHFNVLHYINACFACSKPAWCIYAIRTPSLQDSKWHPCCIHVWILLHVTPKQERSKTSRGVSTLGRLRIRASFLAPAAEL